MTCNRRLPLIKYLILITLIAVTLPHMGHAQQSMEVTPRTVEGFWGSCESECDGSIPCLATSDYWLEWISSRGMSVFYYNHHNDKDTNSDSLVRIFAEMREIEFEENSIVYTSEGPDEELKPWNIDEFSIDRIGTISDGKVSYSCRLNNISPAIIGLTKYLEILGADNDIVRIRNFNFHVGPLPNAWEIIIDAEARKILPLDTGHGSNFNIVETSDQIDQFSVDIDGDGLPEMMSIGANAFVNAGFVLPIEEHKRLISALRNVP